MPLSLAKTKTIVVMFVAAAFVAILLVAGLYFISFAPSSRFGLSRATQDWATFGNYIGGTLGTVFSLLAFFGVLCTVWLQASQLDLASRQAQLDEIQRVLATVSARLDRLLSDPVNHQFKSYKLRSEPADFFRVLSAGGTVTLSPPASDWMVQSQLSEIIGECKIALDPQALVVGIELDQLAWLLGRYTAQGGAASVVDFYRRRYDAVACWLDAPGFAGSHPCTQKIFAPQSLREVLSPQPR